MHDKNHHIKSRKYVKILTIVTFKFCFETQTSYKFQWFLSI